jgi:hypothetical protein
MMKRGIIRVLQKYLLNPPIKLLFAIGTVAPGYALLETIECKTGKPRRTPVGDGRVEWPVLDRRRAWQGRWLRSQHHAQPTRALEGARWFSHPLADGTATLLPDDDPLERQR